MKNSHFIIVLDGSAYKPMYDHMLSDLFDWENVSFVTDHKEDRILKGLLIRHKIQALTRGIIDFLAYEENNLYDAIKLNASRNKQLYVVFLNAAFFYNAYVPGTLKRYQAEWPNIKYILFYLDIIKSGVSSAANMLREEGIFDLVYTIDYSDFVKKNLVFWHTFYSRKEEYLSYRAERDLYFCGAAKGRGEILANIAMEAKKNFIDFKMDVICYEDADLYILGKYQEIIHVRAHDEHIDYPEVLQNELESLCILEVVQEGQMALTLRPYEAIAYNRKLVTNNKSILDFPYYDPAYMQYFEKVEDIDWDWIKRKNEVDYRYDGRYSPVYLLRDIEKRLGSGSH